MVLNNADLRPEAQSAIPSADPRDSGQANGGIDAQEPVTEPVTTAKPEAKPGSGRPSLRRPYRIGRYWSVTQVLGGLLIAGVCVTAVAWYVPRVARANGKALTGSVTSSGILALNFQNPGVISVIKVQPNQPVHKGQVLAVQYAPAMGALIAADNAAISAVQAKIAQLKSDETIYPQAYYPAHFAQDQAQVASEGAQLAAAQARLQSDRQQLAETESSRRRRVWSSQLTASPVSRLLPQASGATTARPPPRGTRGRRSPSCLKGRSPPVAPLRPRWRSRWSPCASRPPGRLSPPYRKARCPA